MLCNNRVAIRRSKMSSNHTLNKAQKGEKEGEKERNKRRERNKGQEMRAIRSIKIRS